MSLLFNIGFIDFNFVDILDILLVTVLFYQLYKLLKGSVAVKIFLGLMSIYLFYLVVNALNMELLSAILGQFIGVGVIAAVILFQQEIRKFLLYIGRTTTSNDKLKELLYINKSVSQDLVPINTIVKAAIEMGFSRTGALIVLTKSDELKFYSDTGDKLDALVSKRLLLSIFNSKSPLHDGAVIIKNNRIRAARCIIPVTEKDDVPANYGLRHRAAIGLSEVTDSLVITVSEESGSLSLAEKGELVYNLTPSRLRAELNERLFAKKIEEEEEKKVEPIKE